MSRVDTHHHVVHPEYAAWLTAKGQAAGGLPIPGWNVESALELMDRHEVSMCRFRPRESKQGLRTGQRV